MGDTDKIEAVGLELDSRRFERAIRRIDRDLEDLEDRFDRGVRAAKKQESAFDNLGKKVLGLAAAYGVFRGAQQATRFIFETNVEFQKLEAQLKTVTGSVEGAAAAFALITKFAVETPFEVQNLTKAFTDLAIRGVNVTEDRLRGLGNVASAFSEDIGRLNDAVISGVNGMIRPLRQFGVDAAINGEKVTLSFQDVTKTVDRTADAISGFVAEIGNTRFADAMAERMKTLDGSISNLKDSASLLAKAIGDAGLNAEISNLVKTIDQAIQDSDEFAETMGKALAGGVKVATGAFELFLEHGDLVLIALEALSGLVLTRTAVGLTRMAAAAVVSARAMGGLNAVLLLSPIGVVAALVGLVGTPLIAAFVAARSETGRLNDSFAEFAETLKKVAQGLNTLSTGRLEGRLIDLKAKEATLRTLVSPVTGPSEEERRLEARLERPNLGIEDRAEKDVARARLLQLRGRRERAEQPGKDLEINLADQVRVQAELDRRNPPATGPSDAFTKRSNALQAEIRLFTEGEAAALRFALALEGIEDAEADKIVTQTATLRGLEDKAEAEEEAIKLTERNAKAIEDTITQLELQGDVLRGDKDALLRYGLELAGASDEQIRLALATAATNRALEEQNENKLKAAERAFERYKDDLRQVSDAADRMAESMSDAFVDIITGADSVGDAFGRMVDSMIRDMLRLRVQPPIEGILGGLFRNALGAGLATSDGSGGLIAGRNDFGPLLPISARAQGTSGPVINQVINLSVSAVDGRDAARFIREQKGEITRVLIDAVREGDAASREIRGR